MQTTNEKLDAILAEIEQLKQAKTCSCSGTSPQAKCDCDDPVEDAKFTKQRYSATYIGLSFAVILAILSFKFLLPVFPICYGLVFVFIGMAFFNFADRFMLIGNSLGRIAKNAVASSIISVAFIGLFGFGLSVGNSYVSDPYSSNTENGQYNVKVEQSCTATGESNSDATVGVSAGTSADSSNAKSGNVSGATESNLFQNGTSSSEKEN